MATLQLTNPSVDTATIRQRKQYIVSIREKFDSGGWQVWRHVEPLTIDRGVAPEFSKATLVFRTGMVKREDERSFRVFAPTDAKGWFIKIESTGGGDTPVNLFTGRISEVNYQRQGIGTAIEGADLPKQGAGPAAIGTGGLVDQEVLCYGLEQLLDLVTIRGVYATNDDVTAFRIDRPVSPNGWLSPWYTGGNRSNAKLPHPDRPLPPPPPEDEEESPGSEGEEEETEVPKAYVFGMLPPPPEEEESPGSEGEEEEPLGEEGPGEDPPEEDPPPVEAPPRWSKQDLLEYLLVMYAPPELGMTLSGQFDALNAVTPFVGSLEGMTVWEAICLLTDRRRGVGCHIETHSDKPTLVVWNAFGEPFRLGSTTVRANPNKLTLHTKAFGHMPAASDITMDVLATFGKVIVRGGRFTSCFSVSVQTEDIQQGWDLSEEEAFWGPPPGTPSGTTPTSEAIERWRMSPRFDLLYRRFIIPETWGWRPGDGESGAVRSNANPKCDTRGQYAVSSGEQAPVTKWLRRLNRTLPIFVTDEQARYETAAFEGPQFQAMTLYVSDGATGWRRSSTGRLGDPVFDIDPLYDGFGFMIRCEPERMTAVGAQYKANPTLMGKAYDYLEMIATIAADTDCRPTVTEELDKDNPRELVIDVPDAETWMIMAGTVIDVVEGGTLVRQQDTEILQDCSPQLQEVASMAKQWYGTPRTTLRCVLNDVTLVYAPGSFITKSDDSGVSTPVNAVVTHIAIDCQRQTTELLTGWAELNFSGASDGLGVGWV